jgi:cellulose synthase/poly-beta-1,6-N-acetylglucosamine synthase-like glycosyltransferase
VSLDLLFSTGIFTLGALIWTIRLGAAFRTRERDTTATDTVDVSIIVPARNEAHNLPALLDSLTRLDPAPREIIVVDDHSTDGTGDIARAAGARVITPAPLPEDWNGKPWACHAGAAAATGRYLLFTDADTVHGRRSLARALSAMKREQADMVSVIPTHIIRAAWERLQGVFQLLLLIATRAGEDNARGERRFVIGQYLLFTRKAYDRIGGHVHVRDRIAEDLALARRVADSGGEVATAYAPGLMNVRMYPEGLGGFFRGWRRNFNEGLAAAGVVAALEMVAVIGWLLGAPVLAISSAIGGSMAGVAVGLGLYLLATVLVAWRQRAIGELPVHTAPLYPVFVCIFVVISALALFDRVRGARVVWKGRQVMHG